MRMEKHIMTLELNINEIPELNIFDNELKYTNHLWDVVGYNTSMLYESIEQSNIKELKYIDVDLYDSVIYPFLFSDEGWIFKSGWGSTFMINQDNFEYYAMEQKVFNPTNDRIGGKTIQYFEHVVDIFKKEILLRDNDLYFLIKKIGRKHQVEIENLEEFRMVNVFTNVSKVKTSIIRAITNKVY